jgi:hypothetical protein
LNQADQSRLPVIALQCKARVSISTGPWPDVIDARSEGSAVPVVQVKKSPAGREDARGE